MLRLIKLLVTTPALLLLLSSSGRADPITDPVGDFLSTYVGPLEGDLDVVSAEVTYRGKDFLFSGTMHAPIGTTPLAFYIWGVDRGARKTTTADFAQLGLPDIIFDLAVRVSPDDVSFVNDLNREIRTPLPPENVSIDGNTISVRVPAELLPMTTDLPPEEYTWNLWPRWNGIEFSDEQISDFAPDDVMAPLTVSR